MYEHDEKTATANPIIKASCNTRVVCMMSPHGRGGYLPLIPLKGGADATFSVASVRNQAVGSMKGYAGTSIVAGDAQNIRPKFSYSSVVIS